MSCQYSFKAKLIGFLIASEFQSIFYWYSEHLPQDLQCDQLVDNTSRHESNSSLIGFPRRCLRTSHRPIAAAGEKHKCDKLVGLLGDEGKGSWMVFWLIVVFSINPLDWGVAANSFFEWSTVCQTQSLQNIRYPQPPASSAPDSLTSWLSLRQHCG